MFESIVNRSPARRWLWTAVVAALVLAVFWPVLSASALYIDDRVYLAENPLVQDPSWASAWRCLSEVTAPSSVRGYYHPLPIISLMIDCACGGQQGSLMPFHRTNVILHLVNVVLVVVLLRRLMVPQWAAILGGLVFGVHPLAVESVAWVGERKALLAGTFELGCLALYVEYVRTSKPATRVVCYAAAVAAMILASMSRPSTVVLPLLLVILDWWPLKRIGSGRWVDKLPFVVVAGIATMVTLVSHSYRIGVQVDTSSSMLDSLLPAAHKLASLAWSAVWPSTSTPWRVAPDPLALSNPVVLGAVVACAAWFLACLSLRRRAQAFVAGSALFVAGIAPTLGFVKYSIVYAFDNYAYAPLFGVVLAFAAGVVAMERRWLVQPWMRIVAIAGLVGLVALEVRATRAQLGHWRDTETLYRFMLSLTPNESILHSDLGLELARQGRIDAAMEEQRRALQLDPRYGRAHNNLGQLQAQAGQFEDAIASYREAIRSEPDLAEACNNLGAALQSTGRLEEAVQAHTQALAVRPDWADAHSNLGVALMKLGRIDDALASFDSAVRFKPDFADAYRNLAECELALGRLDEAVRDYGHAVTLMPANLEFRRNLADLLSQQGRIAEAIEQLREVLRATPDDADARRGLNALLEAQSAR